MNSIEILMKEYEMLRQEILTAINSRNTILTFGIATVGAIFSVSIAVNAFDPGVFLTGFMLMGAVPLINCFVLFIWLGEYQRMQRAGKFIAKLENRINKEKNEKLLSWENFLREKHKHMRYPYDTTIMLLTLISIISIGLGYAILKISFLPKLLSAVIIMIFILWVYFYIVHKMSRMRK